MLRSPAICILCVLAASLLWHSGYAARPSRDNDFNLEDSQISEAEQEAAQVGTQLMAAADSFLAMEVSVREKDRVRQTATVSLLERHGISLEEQFRVFFLTRAHMFGLASVYEPEDMQQKSSALLETQPDPIPASGEDAPKKRNLWNLAKMVKGTAWDTNHIEHKTNEAKPQGSSDARNSTECLFMNEADSDPRLGCKQQPSFIRKVSTLYGEALHTADDNAGEFFKESIVNTRATNGAELEIDAASYQALDQILMLGDSITDFKSPLSTLDVDAYREWKKRQSAESNAWFMALRDKLKRGESLSDASSLKELYQGILLLNNRLSDIDAKIQEASKQQWGDVEQRGFHNFIRRAKLWFKKKAQNFVAGVKKRMKKLWDFFRRKTADSEETCSKEMQTKVKKKAKSFGVPSREKLLKQANMPKEKQKKLMTKQVNAVKQSMDSLEADTGFNTTAKWEATRAKIRMMGFGIKKLQKDASEGVIDTEQVQKTDAEMKDIDKEACTEKHGSVSNKLSGVAHRLGNMMHHSKEEQDKKAKKNPKKWLLPAVGVRGAAVQASFKAWGIEEVVDFRNREIGYFTQGSTQVGTSLASVSVSGYLGLGHHGYKANWSLEDSYQTALYTAVSTGGGFFGLSAGIGLTFALDADNSAGSPWIPDPKGLNGVTVGWSIGATPEALALPINQGIDVGQALYKFHTSECFPNKAAFLAGILRKTCASCYKGMEKLAMGALRTGCWLAGFPIISDLVFFIMWAITEHRREPEWQQHCSSRSTNLRDDPQHLFTMISKKIEDTHQLLKRIEQEAAQLVEILSDALEGNEDANIANSIEMKAVQDLRNKACPASPLRMELAPGRKYWPIFMRAKDEVKKELRALSMVKLIEMCNQLNGKGAHIKCRKGAFNDRPKIERNMRYYIKSASSTNPFGKCNKDSQCPLSDTTCTGASAFKRGDCRCKEGTCYTGNGGASRCVPKPPLLSNETIEAGVKVWVRQRKIELGSFADSLQVLADPDSPLGHKAKEETARRAMASMG